MDGMGNSRKFLVEIAPTEIAPTAPLNSSRLWGEFHHTWTWAGHKNLATLPSLVVNNETIKNNGARCFGAFAFSFQQKNNCQEAIRVENSHESSGFFYFRLVVLNETVFQAMCICVAILYSHHC